MDMDLGIILLNMGQYGHPLKSVLTGLPIKMDNGYGLILGVGPGWTMSRGDLLHFIMEGGYLLMEIGVGCLGLWI